MVTESCPSVRPIDTGKMRRLALMALLACGAVGCSANGVEVVDADAARQALRATLEAWKEGKPIGSLKDQRPSIVAQDLDWEAGATLLQFVVLEGGKEGSINLRIPVELTLRRDAGKEVKKKVQYMVGTSPVITVFRELF